MKRKVQRGLLTAGLLASAAGVCAVGASVSSGSASAAERPAGTRGAAIRDIKGVERTVNATEKELAQVGRQLAQLQSNGASLTANQSSAVTVLFGELLTDKGFVQAMTASFRNPFIEELVPKRKLPTTTTTTSSYVTTDPANLTAAASQLAAIEHALGASEAMARELTTALRDTPGVSEEVSAAIAAQFIGYGHSYQEILAQADAVHHELVQVLNGGAASYTGEEAGPDS